MTKDVLVKITGLQTDTLNEEDEHEPVEIITAASYYEKDGKHYIFYEELEEGSESVTKNRITINSSRIEIQRSGSVNTNMIFDENAKTSTVYETPYGLMTMGISSGRIFLDVQDELIRAGMTYTLDIDSQALLSCELSMQVVPKKNGRTLLADRI